MKRTNLLVLTSCILIAQAGLAQPEKKDAAPKAPAATPTAPTAPAAPKGDAPKQPEGMPSMEEMMKMGEPGENHKLLAKCVGTWDAVVKASNPMTGKTEESKGTAVFTSILGGRFVQTHFNGEFMGTKFEGMGVYGYDNTDKKFTSSWMDTMSTSTMSGTGELSQDKKTLTWTSSCNTPMGKMQTKEVQTFVDDHSMTFVMYSIQGGKENKEMEIVYTRSKHTQEAPKIKDAKPADAPKPAPTAKPATPAAPATPTPAPVKTPK